MILDLEELVPSRETCQRLADADFQDETYFAWVQAYGTYPWQVAKAERMYAAITGDNLLPAPTAAELGALLPDTISVDGVSSLLICAPTETGWHLQYDSGAKMLTQEGPTEAEARALLWLELKERDLLPPESYHREAA